MKLIFVRHTSVDVPPLTCYGQTDVPLKPTFPEEAERVKAGLTGKISGNTPVFTSPLSRCTRLAEYCGFPEAKRDSRLLELNFGEWEMQSFNSIKDPRLQEWFDNWFDTPAPGGESFRNQMERVREFINHLKASNVETALIFTHGGVITNAKNLAGIADLNNIFSYLPEYGEITELEF